MGIKKLNNIFIQLTAFCEGAYTCAEYVCLKVELIFRVGEHFSFFIITSLCSYIPHGKTCFCIAIFEGCNSEIKQPPFHLTNLLCK